MLIKGGSNYDGKMTFEEGLLLHTARHALHIWDYERSSKSANVKFFVGTFEGGERLCVLFLFYKLLGVHTCPVNHLVTFWAFQWGFLFLDFLYIAKYLPYLLTLPT